MAFKIPSISEFRDIVVALGRSLLPELNWGSRRSFHGRMSTFQASAATQLHFHIDSAQRDLHPLTAGEGKPIDDWCFAVGVEKKGASPARKGQAGRIRGAAGATVDPGRQLRHPQTGLLFEIANTTTVTIPGVAGVDPDGYFDADIAGVSTGSATRLAAGESLYFLADPVGIQSEVKLQLDLDEEGFDEEQFGSIRQRFLSTFSGTPSGGSASDFAKWALDSLGSVSKAYAYPNRAGRGSMDIVAFHSGSSRSLSLQDRDAVKAYIQTKAPFQVSGEGGALRVLQTVADPQIVEVAVETNGIQAYQFDWPGVAGVASWDAGLRRLQFLSMPPSLRAGHRIVLVGGVSGSGVGSQDGREYKIESIVDADKVILEKAPPVDPEEGDIIYPGGPLVAPLRDAIVGHLRGEIVYAGRGKTPIPESKAAPTVATGPTVVGLDILAEGIGSANPGNKYGTWAGGIVRASIYQICMFKRGVSNISIIQPAVDYQATDDPPIDGQIHYVTPLAVIVRPA